MGTISAPISAATDVRQFSLMSLLSFLPMSAIFPGSILEFILPHLVRQLEIALKAGRTRGK
jgi:hypothetical protein